LSGEEKKLQALFSELKTADEQAAPHFGAAWNRPQIAPRRVRVFNPAFVAVMMLLVFGVAALAIWSRYSRTTSAPTPEAVVNVLLPTPSNTPALAPPTANTPQETGPNATRTVARRNNAAARHQVVLAANRKLQKDAKSIANWTSPTSALLESPSDEIFSSLPELNQSATQLKSFLPNRSN
jgi:hypothetical protein